MRDYRWSQAAVERLYRGLSRKQKAVRLAQLLNVGVASDPSEGHPDETWQKAERLHDYIAAKLPLDHVSSRTSGQGMAGIPRSITSLLGETIEHDT